jgi:hypothetical protein
MYMWKIVSDHIHILEQALTFDSHLTILSVGIAINAMLNIPVTEVKNYYFLVCVLYFSKSNFKKVCSI